jgi:hypothetical protein
VRKLIVDKVVAVGFDRETKTVLMHVRARGKPEPVEICISAREFEKLAEGFQDLMRGFHAPRPREKMH